jgi:hypothetical protein
MELNNLLIIKNEHLTKMLLEFQKTIEAQSAEIDYLKSQLLLLQRTDPFQPLTGSISHPIMISSIPSPSQNLRNGDYTAGYTSGLKHQDSAYVEHDGGGGVEYVSEPSGDGRGDGVIKSDSDSAAEDIIYPIPFQAGIEETIYEPGLESNQNTKTSSRKVAAGKVNFQIQHELYSPLTDLYNTDSNILSNNNNNTNNNINNNNNNRNDVKNIADSPNDALSTIKFRFQSNSKEFIVTEGVKTPLPNYVTDNNIKWLNVDRKPPVQNLEEAGLPSRKMFSKGDESADLECVIKERDRLEEELLALYRQLRKI